MESGTNVSASYRNVQNSTRARRMSTPGSGERGPDQEQEEVKKSLPWLRVYTDAYRHPKLVRLSDKLHRFWFGCLCLAGEHGGVLPALEDIALHLRVHEHHLEGYTRALIKAGLIDETPDGLVLHNWSDRQYSSDLSTERVREFRKRRETVSETFPKRRETVSETAPDTDTEQIQSRTDTEQNGVRVRPIRAADLNGQAPQRFDEFWTVYPLKDDRDSAARMYLSVVTLETEMAVLACLNRYLLSDLVARGAIMAAWKWLQQQHRNNWAGDWPKVREPPVPKRRSLDEIAVEAALELEAEEREAAERKKARL